MIARRNITTVATVMPTAAAYAPDSDIVMLASTCGEGVCLLPTENPNQEKKHRCSFCVATHILMIKVMINRLPAA